MVSIRSVKITRRSLFFDEDHPYSVLFKSFNNLAYLEKSAGLINSRAAFNSFSVTMSGISPSGYFFSSFLILASILLIQAAGEEKSDFSRLVLNKIPFPLVLDSSICNFISAKIS